MIALCTKKILFSYFVLFVLGGLVYGASVTTAAANPQMNYQGKLTTPAGVSVPDGTYNMRFWLLTSPSVATSSALWTESLTSTEKVQVTNGLFSIMLGSTTPLTSVDFNQTLYLGVEIGGTSTPAWDGEMSPRKILGTVPAAFVAETAVSAEDAFLLGGVASTSFLRSDQADTMAATSTGSLLTLVQNGAGAVARFFSGVTEVFTILSNGNVGVGTSTPSAKFAVSGNAVITGTTTLATTTATNLTLTQALGATSGGTGLSTITQNQLLIGGAGNTWTQVATSSLGLGNGTFLGLSDTPSSYTANRLFFTNSGGTAVTDSASLVFNGTNFGIGSTTPSARLTIQGVSGATSSTFTIASSTGITTLAMLANGNLELPGQLISAGINWTARSAAEANFWGSVTYGNGLFVAVGYSGTNRVMTSPDGITWTARAAAEASTWVSVTYGNGLFVAVANSGTNRVMTSPDGITWTARTATEANSWLSVTYGNGLFVAVSFDGTNRVMTSPDGITWTARTAAQANQWYSVTYGNGLFVAVSFDGTNRVMTSPDGITWTARTAAQANAWISVTYGNGLFVAVSADGTNRVMTSPNGITWTARTAAEASSWYSVTFGNGLFVAVADAGTNRVMTSPDGITWTARTAAEANNWVSVTYGNGLFVAVGYSGTNRVMTSGFTETSALAHNNIYQGGTTFMGGLRAGTTTASVASIFLQSQAGINPFAIASSSGASLLTLTQAGQLGIGTTTPFASSLTMQQTGISGTSTAGIGQYFEFVNSVANQSYFGNQTNIFNIPTATSTLVGSILRITDNSALGNTVRGLEVQANRGTNTLGENTGISGFGRTFGVRGTTDGDAGAVAAPAGVFAESRGTTQGNALRAYSGNITSSNLVSFYQDTSAFTGTGLLMNFGNGSGSFTGSSAKFIDLQNAGVSRMVVTADGKLGLATSSPSSLLTVAGDTYISGGLTLAGAFKDSQNATGTLGMVLQSTGTSTRWVATSTLGISGATSLAALTDVVITGSATGTILSYDGSSWVNSATSTLGIALSDTIGTLAATRGGTGLSTITQNQLLIGGAGNTWTQVATSSLGLGNGTFLGLSDTPGSYTANRLFFTNAGGTAVTDSASLVFNGTNFGIGSTTPSARLTVQGASGATSSTFTIASSTGSTTLAMLANGNLELPGQLISAGINWRVGNLVNTSFFGADVVYGNGQFVALGAYPGGIYLSENGNNWSTTTGFLSGDWYSITYGNGLFVAVGDGFADDAVMTSPDGVTWTARTASEVNSWYSVTYGNGLFVAVAYDAVMTSPDGITWTARTAAEANIWNSVTYGNGLFVAVSSSGTNRVMTSPDGITWTARTAAQANSWTSVTYGNGLFVAVAGDGTNRIMTSPDGITWTARTAAQANSWTSVTYGNGLFVAVAGDGTNRIMTSPDGITWTARTAAQANTWSSITYGNGLFVAVSSDGTNRVMTSGFTETSALAHNNIYQGGTTFMGGLRAGTTTASVASVFLQSQAGINPFAIASSTGASLLTLTQAGKLGIGTTTPGAKLTIQGTADTSDIFSIASSSGVSLLTVTAQGGVGLWNATNTLGFGSIVSGVHTISADATNNSGSALVFGYGNQLLDTVGLGYATLFGSSNVLSNAATLDTSSLYGSSNTLSDDANLAYSSFYGSSNTLSGAAALNYSALYGSANDLALDAYLLKSSLFGSSNIATGTTYIANSALYGDANSYLGNMASSSIFGSNNTIEVGDVDGLFLYGAGNTISNTVTNAFVVGSNNTVDDIANVFAVGNGLATLRSDFVTFDNVLNIDTATNMVGIGTTTPSSRLTIVGAAGTANPFTVASSSGASMLSLTAQGRLVFGTSTNADIFLNGGAGTTTAQQNANNIAIGNQAFLYASSTALAEYNIALGYRALFGSSAVPMTGGYNFAAGLEALFSNTTGSFNNALGYWSLRNNTTGSDNNAFGQLALRFNTTGSNNNALGQQSLLFNTTGSNNSALGVNAGYNMTTGTSTTFLGAFTNTTLGSVSSSTAIGAGALLSRSNSMVLGGTGANSVDIVSGTSTPWAKLSIMNNFGSTTALFDIATTTSSAFATSSLFRINANGNVGIGSSSPSSLLTVAGNTFIDGSLTAAGTTTTRIITSTSTLSIDSATTSALTIGTAANAKTITVGNTTGATALNFNTGTGGSTFTTTNGTFNLLTGTGAINIGTNAAAKTTTIGNNTGASSLIFNTGTGGSVFNSGNVAIGTTSTSSRLTIVGAAGASNVLTLASSTGATTLAMLANGNLELPGQLISAGINWTARTAASSSAWSSVTYGNGRFVAVANNAVMYSGDGINWATSTAAASSGWTSVTYGNGLFVAVAQGGTNLVMTSPDGITWTIRMAAEANPWYSVTYGNGLFVAVAYGGTNRVMTSPDGVTWNARTAAAANQWYSVTYGNGLFVAVSWNGTNQVMTSPDGITWTARTAAQANSWYSVTYGNGLFVAVSQDGTNRVMTSPDGVTWTARTAAEANSWYSVTYGNGLFVAVADSGTNRVMTSPDGSTWTARAAAEANSWYSITFGNGRFVAVSSDGTNHVMTSGFTEENQLAHNNIYQGGTTFMGGLRAGTTTASVASVFLQSQAGINPFAIASSTGASLLTLTQAGNLGLGTTTPASKLTVVGAAGSANSFTLASSTGATTLAMLANGNLELPGQLISAGINWTARTAASSSAWYSVAYGNGKFVSVGTNAVMYSDDGINWSTTTAAEANSWLSVTYGNGLFVAVADSGTNRVMTSPDGITWTARTAAQANFWYSIIYGNGLFVAVGELDLGTNPVMTSPDGITWTARTAAGNNDFWYSITYGNGQFVVVGDALFGDGIMTSSDGVTWTARTAALANPWVSVTYGNGLFVAVSSDGTNRVMTSPDGITWTARSAAEANTWLSVTYGNGLFVAVADSGTNRVMTSPDGITWTARTAAQANQWWSVTYGNGLFVAVAQDGTNRVMTSGFTETSALAHNNIYQGGTSFMGGLRAGTTTANVASIFLQSQAGINPFAIASSTGLSLLTLTQAGNLGLGTTTPAGRLSMENTGLSGDGIAGIDQFFTYANGTASAIQYGNRSFLRTTNSTTTTLVGDIIRLEDSTAYANTVRGLEVQVERGTNTLGENTAISGFARTFGLRGVTEGDAGAVFEPAGVYGETQGTTQGNALRGYSSTITTAALLKLFQDSSAFTGTGLLMNFGNSGGSFSSTTASRFIDLQNAGTSRFTVGAYGMLTIGDGTTGQNAGLQIGNGGICVDNDGTCTASTTGRITSVSTASGNSDLAEMYFSSEDLLPGEVVYMQGGLSVGRATTETKGLVFGVVSTEPGLLLGHDDTSLVEGEAGYPIALSGRVPVRLSNENGPIEAGDELMLSSLPGVVMKATSTGKVVGIALEDFDENRAYSDTFINQFGENIIVPNYTPINRESDPRINDGCYYSGGGTAEEAPCVPLTTLTEVEQYDEADALALAEAKAEALEALAEVPSTKEAVGEVEVQVGQIIMFVDLGYRYFDAAGAVMIRSFLASSTNATSTEDTIWSRLVTLAENFVDGVLSVFTLKADRVETKELCVEGVCVNASELQELLERQNPEAVVEVHEAPPAEGDNGGGDEPTEPAPVEPEAPGTGGNETPADPEPTPEVPTEPTPEPVPPQDTGTGSGEVAIPADPEAPAEPAPEPSPIPQEPPVEPAPEPTTAE